MTTEKLSDDERMKWWRDSKFGMFIHWGAYSIIGGERGEKIAGGSLPIMGQFNIIEMTI